jgi:PAS domain-containing protein
MTYSGTYRCSGCSLTFSNLAEWRKSATEPDVRGFGAALKFAQAALGHGREHLRELFSLSADGVVVADHEELDRLPSTNAQLRTGERHVGPWALRRKDGRVVPVELRARFQPAGRRSGYLRDITERKHARSRAQHGQ